MRMSKGENRNRKRRRECNVRVMIMIKLMSPQQKISRQCSVYRVEPWQNLERIACISKRREEPTREHTYNTEGAPTYDYD